MIHAANFPCACLLKAYVLLAFTSFVYFAIYHYETTCNLLEHPRSTSKRPTGGMSTIFAWKYPFVWCFDAWRVALNSPAGDQLRAKDTAIYPQSFHCHQTVQCPHPLQPPPVCKHQHQLFLHPAGFSLHVSSTCVEAAHCKYIHTYVVDNADLPSRSVQ